MIRRTRSLGQRASLLALILVVLCTDGALAIQILGYGCDGEIVGNDPVHCWRSIGADTPGRSRVPEMQGTVFLVRWFEEFGYGNDTNIFIRPDPEFEWVVQNLADDTNSALDDGAIPAGLIEAEVMNLAGLLDKVILPGMKVRAKGWWVEDVFHDKKTELHPLIYIVADRFPRDQPGSGNDFVVYVTEDMSGRFDVSTSPNASLFFPMDPLFDTKRPDQGYSGELTDVELLRESMLLDFLPSPRRSRASAYVRAEADNDQLQIYVDLDEYFVDVSKPENSYLPFYLGRFARVRNRTFRDEISYSVVGSGGSRAVELKIKASLEPTLPSGEQIQRSTWQFAAAGVADPSTTVQSSGHAFEATVRYSPANNQFDYSWDLAVTGQSVTGGFVPPSLAEALASFEQNTPRRTSLIKRRRYAVQPSYIELGLPQETSVRPNVTVDNAFRIEPPRCDNPKIVATPHILPNVNLVAGSFKWTVRKPVNFGPLFLPQTAVAMGTGAPVFSAQAPVHELSPGDVVQTSSYKLTASTSQPYSLEIQWSGSRFFGEERLMITAEGRTDIGEEMSTSIGTSSRCPLGTTRAAEFFEDMIKGLIAIEKYGDRFRVPHIPRTIVLDDMRINPEYLGRALRGSAKDKVAALGKYLNGEKLSQNDRSFLKALSEVGATVEWDRRQDARSLVLLKRGITASLAVREHLASRSRLIDMPQPERVRRAPSQGRTP